MFREEIGVYMNREEYRQLWSKLSEEQKAEQIKAWAELYYGDKRENV
jgi:hypothetical protein